LQGFGKPVRIAFGNAGQKTGSGIAATTFKLEEDVIKTFLDGVELSAGIQINPKDNKAIHSHDAFRNGGGKYAKGRLGRRAGEIYELLFTQPLTLKEIQSKVGCSIDTVKRTLKRLSFIVDRATGEIIEMISFDGEYYYSNLVDLNLISAIVGTYGKTGKIKEQYEQERRERNKNLEIGLSNRNK